MIVSGMECTIARSKGAVDEAMHSTVQREGCFPPFLELRTCLRTTFRQDFARQGRGYIPSIDLPRHCQVP